MNQVFDFKRMMLLAKFKFNLHKKVLFLSVMGYFALLFIIGFFIAYANRDHTVVNEFFTIFHYVSLPILMVLGSVLLAGRSFQDMNTPEKSTNQILIPASSFEKYSIYLVSTSLLWMIFSFVFYQAFSVLFNGLWSALYGFEFVFFNAFDIFDVYMIDQIIIGYLLMHSIYLLGAAAFKKYPIVKTLLSQFIIHWAFSIFGFILMLIFFGSPEGFGIRMDSIDHNMAQWEWLQSLTEEELINKARFLLRTVTILLTAALYVTGYYKLKEREV